MSAARADMPANDLALMEIMPAIHRAEKQEVLDVDFLGIILRVMMGDLPDGVGTRFGDLSGLPDELLRQIPAARIDETEGEILELLRDSFDGVASVDEVLVGLYRKHGVIHDRRKIAGKLYRMVNAKPPLLVGVEKRRGVYRIP